jgi:O-antigen/teichoic acid export membrane protein
VIDVEVPRRTARLRSRVTGLARDSLYRNSFFLMLNSGVTGLLGVAFWGLASRLYPAHDVGSASALISAASFVATAATLGLPNTVMRFLASDANPRRLVSYTCWLAGATGAAMALVWVIVPGHFGAPLASVAHPWPIAIVLIAAAVAGTAVGMIGDSAIIARRESQLVVEKNTVGSVVKLAALPLLVGLGAEGLFGGYALSTVIATGMALMLLWRRWGRHDGSSVARVPVAGVPIAEVPVAGVPVTDAPSAAEPGALAGRKWFAAGNHLATLVAIIPSSTLTVVVVDRLGATKAAYFAIPLLIVGFLNVIPSVTAQSLFAEVAADNDGSLIGHLRKALIAIYGLAVPVIAVLVVGAPLVLSLFGAAYSRQGAGCLRYLALAGLFASFNYVADVVLVARSKVAGYVFLNVAGTVSAFGFPVLFMSGGLTALGLGWFIGQIGYAALAVGTLAVCYGPRRRRVETAA